MDPVAPKPINPPPYEPANNFERAVIDRLEAQDSKIEQLMKMVCPVCGPIIHAANHPDKIRFDEPHAHEPDLKNGT